MLPLVGGHLWQEFLAGVLRTAPLNSEVGSTSVFGQTPLVTSVKQCMAQAVTGLMKSWKSNLANRVARLVMRSDRYAANDSRRHQLLWLNRLGLWRVPYAQQALKWAADKPEAPVLDPHASRLMARYLRLYVVTFKGPKFDNLPLQVNQMSSVLAAQSQAHLDGVSHWLRMSTLERGQRIELPLRANPYAEQFKGDTALTFSFYKKRRGWCVKVVKTFENAAVRVEGPTVGLDFGMTNLLATSTGALYERGFNEKLKCWDTALVRITQGLQGAGELQLRECRRYRDFLQRFRSWLKSHIKGAVNRALAQLKPAKVVIEDLGFHAQPGDLSKRMNRLVRRMGTGIFKEALSQKAVAQGFKVEVVNPAYTSQECRSCGFLARDSRRGNRYRCVCCDRQGHADALAAANLVERFHQGRSALNSNHKTLGVQGLQRWGERMLARLARSTPGTSRHEGALRCARVGLQWLEKKNSGALRRWESLQKPNVLSDLMRVVGLIRLNELSTRYSG